MPSNVLLLDVLKRFANTLVGRFDVAEVLYELSDHTVEVLGATAAGVCLSDESGALKFVSANSEPAIELETTQQETGHGPCHDAFLSGRPVLVNDLTARTDWPLYRARAEALGLVAVAGIPMRLDDRTLGALNIYDRERRDWSDEDVLVAFVLADIATSFVAHSSELDQARRINAQLQDALDSRILIEQAKGLLAGERGISMEQSFELLRGHARRNNANLRAVAEAVVHLGLRPGAAHGP